MKKIVYLLLIGMLVLKIFESTDTVRAQEQLAPPSEEEWDLAWRSDGSYLWISENLRQDTTEGFFKLDTFVDAGDKFYYVDDEKNTVNTINYDGSDRQTIVDAEGEYIEGIYDGVKKEEHFKPPFSKKRPERIKSSESYIYSVLIS